MTAVGNNFITPQSLKTGTVVCNSANTDYDDAPSNASATPLITAGPNGARVVRVQAIPRATVTATQLQLFRDGDGSETTKRFFDSALMPAYTMSGTTAVAAKSGFDYSDADPLILAPNEKVFPGIGVASAGGIVFVAEWQDY